jgi:hypothetical protein
MIVEFGVKWHPRIEYDPLTCCPNCCFDIVIGLMMEANETDDYKTSHDCIIGFSTVIPRESHRKDIVGIAIYSCPKCQTQVWWHMDINNLNSFTQ